MKSSVLLVEDDLLSAKLIERNLQNFPEFQLEHTAISLKDAIAYLDNHVPELVILDIELPDGKGFELMPYLTGNPKVVVLTGDESYAFTAFEHGAIDFLKKPVTPPRFKACLEKIMAFNKNTPATSDKPFLFVKAGFKYVRVNIDEILYAEAVGDYVKLHLKGKKSVLVNISLRDLLSRIEKYSFAQVHRSYIISLAHIDSVDDEGVTMGEQIIPVGKTYKPFLNRLLQ
jgi:DNA-binding LytR/AlgR family response regulator